MLFELSLFSLNITVVRLTSLGDNSSNYIFSFELPCTSTAAPANDLESSVLVQLYFWLRYLASILSDPVSLLSCMLPIVELELL